MPDEVSLFDGRWWVKNPPPPAAAKEIGTRSAPYLAVPAEADSWNFEARNAKSADLADNGWIVQRFDSPYTLLTRAGELPALAFSESPPDTYFSSLIDGVLLCTFPHAAAVQIYKPTGAPLSRTYRARIYNAINAADSTDANYLFVSNWPNYRQAGQLYYVGFDRSTWQAVVHKAPNTWEPEPGSGGAVPWNGTDVIKTINSGYTPENGGGTPHGLGMWFARPNGQNWAPAVNRSANNGRNSFFTTDMVVSYAGIVVQTSISNPVAIDFIRRGPLWTF